MIAATVFFFAEAATVASHWKTTLHVGGLVTLVAGVHYMYMREYWGQVHSSPIVYRYVDWSITVPLQMIEFNLILKAAGKPVGAGMFWRLFLGTVAMLAFGYMGETHVLPAWPAFGAGLAGWAFILTPQRIKDRLNISRLLTMQPSIRVTMSWKPMERWCTAVLLVVA